MDTPMRREVVALHKINDLGCWAELQNGLPKANPDEQPPNDQPNASADNNQLVAVELDHDLIEFLRHQGISGVEAWNDLEHVFNGASTQDLLAAIAVGLDADYRQPSAKRRRLMNNNTSSQNQTDQSVVLGVQLKSLSADGDCHDQNKAVSLCLLLAPQSAVQHTILLNNCRRLSKLRPLFKQDPMDVAEFPSKDQAPSPSLPLLLGDDISDKNSDDRDENSEFLTKYCISELPKRKMPTQDDRNASKPNIEVETQLNQAKKQNAAPKLMPLQKKVMPSPARVQFGDRLSVFSCPITLNQLLNASFFVFDTNSVLTRGTRCHQQLIELALVRFSLGNGIEGYWHQMISPNANAEQFLTVGWTMKRFLDQAEWPNANRVVLTPKFKKYHFASVDQLEHNLNLLRRIQKNGRQHDRDFIWQCQVLDLFEAVNQLAELLIDPLTDEVMRNHILFDREEIVAKINCEHHEGDDNWRCALGTAKRWVLNAMNLVYPMVEQSVLKKHQQLLKQQQQDAVDLLDRKFRQATTLFDHDYALGFEKRLLNLFN